MKVAIVRHAEAKGDTLLPEGEAQAKSMGAFLKTLNFSRIQVLCTDARRAALSAKLIAEVLGLELKFVHIFHTAATWHRRSQQAEQDLHRAIADAPGCELTVIVTHQPDVEQAWRHFQAKFSPVFDAYDSPLPNVRYMEGFLIDEEVKTITFIPHKA